MRYYKKINVTPIYIKRDEYFEEDFGQAGHPEAIVSSFNGLTLVDYVKTRYGYILLIDGNIGTANLLITRLSTLGEVVYL